MGVLISVAVATISTLPKIAFSRPPADPGGGVICVNSFGEIALTPLRNSTARIHDRNSMPNAIVASDIARLMR